jgi:hypothetical protein
MLYLAQFHNGAVAAAFILGLGMGWIALVHRGTEMAPRWLIRIGVLIALLVVVSATHALRGSVTLDKYSFDLARAAYWLDLALLLLAAYFVGCAVGTGLRSLLLAHQSRRREKAP